MIDLFRPYVNAQAQHNVAHTLTYREQDGRLYIGEGPRVAEFEREFAALTGVSRVLALNSCTSAIDLALHLCGVGPGDDVITTPMTCSATNTHIVLRGARPVWADVDPITGLIDPECVRRQLTPRTRAVIAVDWAGRRCDYERLRYVLRDACFDDVPIIQDAAHSLTAGLGGDYVCFSFQAIKHLTTGDGGALITPHHCHERARLLRWYGLDRTQGESFRCSQNIGEAGFKYHMNDIAASMGLGNLPDVPKIVARHRENAAYYHQALAGCPGVTLPPPDDSSAWWLYTLLTDGRDELIERLASKGIESSPVHTRNDKHSAFNFPNGPLPGVDAFASRELAIPTGWWVTNQERERIADAVVAWAGSRSGALV